MVSEPIIVTLSVFGREVVAPGLKVAANSGLVLFFISIFSIVVSHLCVDHARIARSRGEEDMWIYGVLPIRKWRPLRDLTSLGRKLRCYGWVCLGISVLLFVMIWKLAE